MDIAAGAGTEIVAPDAGRVVLVDDQFFSGNTVVIDHGNGIVSLYAHLRRTAVAVGDVVERGTPLGSRRRDRSRDRAAPALRGLRGRHRY